MKIAHKALLVSITSFLFVLSGCTAKDKSNNPSAKKSTPIHNNINNSKDFGKYFILEKRKISQSEFNDVLKKKCGYFEDRRPASNMDPYLVTSKIFETTVLNNITTDVRDVPEPYELN